MAHDPHHDSIIESIKEIFARYREMEDRLEFLEHELNALADPDGCGDRKDMATLLEAYHAEFGDGEVRAAKIARAKVAKVWEPKEGGIGCQDCYDFICDACGEHKEGEPAVINSENLAGVVMCQSCQASVHPPNCKWHKDWHACDCGLLDDISNKL